MKSKLLVLIFFCISNSFAQSGVPDFFLDGKSVVLISNAPSARPVMGFEEIAHQVHQGLVEAGGDPVGYFELEEIVLNEEIQAGYASLFAKRLINGIVILTRLPNGAFEMNMAPFSNNKNIVNPGSSWSMRGSNIKELNESLIKIGEVTQSKNLLVLEVPEFPQGSQSGSSSYISRNPLNLNVFRLGIPLSGAGGEGSHLTSFRYDLLGRSDAERARSQEREKEQLQAVFETSYPHQVVFLTEAKTSQELIRDRVQFVLRRVEGREGDLMKSMGVSGQSPNPEKVVVKYYIHFLVRDELYIGPKWDADANWQVALTNFLQNLNP
ncbi:NTPase [Litoribacter alkaliphilus]|uniref:NTPase n=1 Tax=Litoribacter ruber TaxID=702568 RepID=A0AAP2CGF7_9BACT|nr:NTPase [Litoribacter alkaliphilus]MBS9523345.1 NTPase [Litoribacter alkaliphilus]